MEQYYFEHGPKICIEFEIENNSITKSTITSKTENGTVCKILGDSTVSHCSKAIVQWMGNYCSGKEPDVLLPLDLNSLPPFAHEVLRVLQRIPFGEVTTYKDLAEMAGSPRAARAVGNACSNNPFHLVIPCHRVIKSSGQLGGFTIDLSIKSNLLDHES